MTRQLWDAAQPPVSFVFDGRRFDATNLKFEQDEQGAIWNDPSGLQARAVLRTFKDSPAVDWVVEFTNTSQSELPLLEQVRALDLHWPCAPDAVPTLHGNKGSVCAMDDFLPFSHVVEAGETALAFAPAGGRSSDGAFPFFNLEGAGEGLVFVLGWSGQWNAGFAREDNGVHIQAGMETLSVKLQPGESIRTPRVLLLPWSGDDVSVGDNLLRRLLLAEYCPRDAKGEIGLPPVAHMTMSQFHATGITSEANELDALQKAYDLGCEAFWVDACWYGQNGKWYENVGDWRIRPEAFPNGLKPIGDAARERGMKFVLWFEPERVVRETPIETEHPEWLLYSDGDGYNRLFNLGLPAAREYMTDLISKIIGDSGVTIYRQDFNFSPLPFWQQADEHGREGMTEMRHIEGLYAMWDELQRRHPGLLIDNCASGGRRLDLETTMRSFPLWRSDFSDTGGPAHGAGLQVGDQSQTAGLSRRLPLHAASAWTFSPYTFRSSMSSGVCLYCGIQGEDFPAREAKTAIAELKRLRPHFLGDFYDLAPLTLESSDWCAYQFYREDLNGGFALFLRRHESEIEQMDMALRAVDPQARYRVTLSPTFEQGESRETTGEELQNLQIQIAEKASSLLLEYAKIEA